MPLVDPEVFVNRSVEAGDARPRDRVAAGCAVAEGGDLAGVLTYAIHVSTGVEETLEYLVTRHDLTICTKGQSEEQKLKVDRSGLAVYFGHCEIVPEKHPGAYRELIEKRGLAPESTWMIGNSPKSDINPALEVGLNAVYIPHQHTWQLEHEPVVAGTGKLVILPAFRELRGHF